MRLAQTNMPPRRGFTLTEMLVVIAIIAILSALGAAAIMAWMSGSQRGNSERVIRGINAVFQKHWSYVIDQAKKETPSSYVLNLAGNDPKRAQVVWIKTRLMEAFPMTYGEINNPNDPVCQYLKNAIPHRRYWATYMRQSQGYLQDNSANPPLNKPPQLQHFCESGACLLMALSVSRQGATLDPDIVAKFSGDTDGDGVNELRDGFNQPLFFYRFAWNVPGGSPNIQSLNPGQGTSARLADPLDPTGTLMSWSGGNRNTFQNLFHPIAIPNTTNAFYVTPVIMSIGGDQTPGLPIPGQPMGQPGATAFSALSVNPGVADNAFSYNLKGAN